MTTGAPVELASLEHIAVVRVLPGLGDMLCLVPALRSLRRSAPRARITLVGLPSSGWMVERYPQLIDAFVPVPGCLGKRDPTLGAQPRAVVAAERCQG